MHRLLLLTVIAALWPAAASAQFSNYSLGFEAGYAVHSNVGVDPHVTFGPTTSIYVENGFEAAIRFDLGFAKETKVSNSVFYLAPALGVRYNILSDLVRPQIIGEIAFYHYFSAKSLVASNIFAAGLGFGLELFLRRDLSFTFLGVWHRMLIVGADDGNALVGAARVATYF